MSPRAGLSWMGVPRFAEVAGAAWDSGRIGAVEATLEHLFRPPEGAHLQLIEAAAASGWLLGHGVHYSVLSSRWTAIDRDWLDRVAALCARWPFRWVSEHFGVVRAGSVWAAPLSVPYTESALARGRERLDRLAQAAGVPVGLENLAFAWAREDALRQADFVDALLEPVDGLMVLDLHNLWCQAVNFGIDPVALIERQPLHRVRQLHLSGGSWSDWPEGRFRRDTHDGAVPAEVWALLPQAVARCPQLEVVTLERLGEAIERDPDGWADEVQAFAQAVAQPVSPVGTEGVARVPAAGGDPAEAWDRVFEAGADPQALVAAGAPWLAGADPRALRTAGALLERWGRPIPGQTGG